MINANYINTINPTDTAMALLFCIWVGYLFVCLVILLCQKEVSRG